MIKLIYFDFPFWRIDILRLCLAYGDVKYSLKKISRERFLKKKRDGNLQFPFGQLPVMVINEKMFGQTSAIARYCAIKSKLYNFNPEKSLVIDQVLDWSNDITIRIAPSIREKNKQKKIKLRKKFAKNDLILWFGFLEKLLKNSSKQKLFFTGNFSLADITAWRVIHWFCSGKLDHIDSDFLKKFKKLHEFYFKISNYKNLKNLKEFQEII